MNRISTTDLLCNEKLEFLFGPKQKSSSELTETKEKISLSVFTSWLEEVKKEKAPFKALSQRCASHITIELESGSTITCKLYEKAWESTAFGRVRKGTFCYIDLNDEESEQKDPLFRLRMSQDRQTGEWLWVNRGKELSGKKVMELAEKISRSMSIKKCFLADAATITTTSGKKMHIRIPLQIMKGHGFYGPLFSIANVNQMPSNVAMSGSEKKIEFHQDRSTHKKNVTWMQNLKVSEIQNLLTNDAKKQLIEILERNKIAETSTFQLLLETLYKSKESSPDYENTVFLLLDFPHLVSQTTRQKKYVNILGKLNTSMLLSASFN